MELKDLIERLSRPEAYPHSVDEVVVHQTHISVVFLAGQRAYKLKKPVDFDFVDYSTLERRRHFCDEEVRLNRRLAPDVYRGVVPVTATESGCRIDGDGEVVEWAVEMQRLPDEATLEARLGRREVRASWFEELAERLGRFHRRADSGPEVSEYARWEVVAKNVRENFSQSSEQVGTTVDPEVFERFETLSERALQSHRELIERRADELKGRDTHGDLRLEHVYLLPDEVDVDPGDHPEEGALEEGKWKWSVVDCVEFNDAFRYADPVSDMAFLTMDLVGHGRRDLAELFARRYFESTGDRQGAELLDLYVAYRAAVRAKVQGLKAVEQEVEADQREQSRQRSAAHWLLGYGRLETPGRRPCLVLIGGLPGTGKSTLAERLAARADFEVIDSDVVRKELAAADGAEMGAGFESGIYTREWSDKTYDECLRRAESMLFEGKRVIVDASFHDRGRRRRFLETGADWGVPGVFLWCRTRQETLRQRLDARSGDVSDADWSVCQKMREKWSPLDAATRRDTAEIETDGAVDQTVEAAVDALAGRGLAERSPL